MIREWMNELINGEWMNEWMSRNRHDLYNIKQNIRE